MMWLAANTALPTGSGSPLGTGWTAPLWKKSRALTTGVPASLAWQYGSSFLGHCSLLRVTHSEWLSHKHFSAKSLVQSSRYKLSIFPYIQSLSKWMTHCVNGHILFSQERLVIFGVTVNICTIPEIFARNTSNSWENGIKHQIWISKFHFLPLGLMDRPLCRDWQCCSGHWASLWRLCLRYLWYLPSNVHSLVGICAGPDYIRSTIQEVCALRQKVAGNSGKAAGHWVYKIMTCFDKPHRNLACNAWSRIHLSIEMNYSMHPIDF